jgi:hypothetical protein
LFEVSFGLGVSRQLEFSTNLNGQVSQVSGANLNLCRFLQRFSGQLVGRIARCAEHGGL